MDIWKVIAEFLGIQGVFFEDIKQYRKEHKALLRVRLKGSHCFCKACGLELGNIKDWQFKKVQGPSMGIYQQIFITVFFPRAWCEGCRKHRPAHIPWIHNMFPSMTCGFTELAGRMMEETTCRAASRLLGSSARKMWELDEYRMKTMLQYMRLPNDVDLSFLSADEVHFLTLRRERKSIFSKKYEPKFITNLVSYVDSKVLFNASGRGKEALEECFKVLSPGQRLCVEKVAVDMHDPFISAIKAHLPNAEVCVDRFHLTQSLNRCFDEVRRSELKKAKDQFTQGMLAPSRRFVLVGKDKRLSKGDEKLLDKLRRLNANIHNAMLLVEYFHHMLQRKSIPPFRKELLQWYCLVRESKLKPFRRLAKLIRKYRSNIEAYILTRLTTSVSEGINNKIKTLKRMAYNYTNEFSFRMKVLQRCGYLNSYWINTDKWLYTTD